MLASQARYCESRPKRRDQRGNTFSIEGIEVAGTETYVTVVLVIGGG